MELTGQNVDREKKFLEEVGSSLNSAMFIIDRLTEELRQEEGRLENDPEVGQLFHHLADCLIEIDKLIKNRRSLLRKVIEEELKKQEPPTTDLT